MCTIVTHSVNRVKGKYTALQNAYFMSRKHSNKSFTAVLFHSTVEKQNRNETQEPAQFIYILNITTRNPSAAESHPVGYRKGKVPFSPVGTLPTQVPQGFKKKKRQVKGTQVWWVQSPRELPQPQNKLFWDKVRPPSIPKQFPIGIDHECGGLKLPPCG